MPDNEKPPVACMNTQANLFSALAKAQGVMKNPERNRTVTVKTQTGPSYTFDYATLDNIIDTARKALSDNGIAVTQCLERDHQSGGTVLITRLLHRDGGALVNEMPVELPKAKKRVLHNGTEVFDEPRIQEMGSILTYARRYALCAILNIAAEEDDDGSRADGPVTAPRAAPPPAAGKTATTGARDEYKRLHKALSDAPDAISLAEVLLTNKDALLLVKKASEEGYAALMKLKDDRAADFANAQT